MAPYILPALLFVGILSTFVSSQTCNIPPRPAGQLVEDPSFEQGDREWAFSGPDNQVVTLPAWSPHSGAYANLMSATYQKSPGSAAVKTTSYTQQHIIALPGRTYGFKFNYRIASYGKGSTCPSSAYPLSTCKLVVSYAFQDITTIPITAATGSYAEYSAPFLPSTGGRYIQFDLRCDAPTPEPESGCADVKLLLDDVTFSDPGWDCSWRTWGCFSDSVNFRSLPHHGTIPGWPATTTVEACCNACANQGFWYAGLEFGNECWCGNGLGGVNQTVGDGGCNMPCEGYPSQICGGPDRLSVYHHATWP